VYREAVSLREVLRVCIAGGDSTGDEVAEQVSLRSALATNIVREWLTPNPPQVIF